MALAWTLAGALGVAAFLAAGTAAAVVYFTRPHRAQNRFLALALASEAIYMGGGGLDGLLADPAGSAAAHAVRTLGGALAPPAFLLLLSTLDWPLAPLLRHPLVRRLLLALALLLPLGYFAAPDQYVAGVQPGLTSPWEGVNGPFASAHDMAALAAFALSLVAAVWAFRRAPAGSVARRQARAYLVAFGTRDSIYICTITLGASILALGSTAALVAYHVVPATSILFVALLAVGILRTQLFDLDLKVKWTLRQSTIAAAFVAVFFVASEAAALLFAERVGPILGIVAAGMLVFALAPLQRAADRLADRAMPTVQPSSEYLTYKKLEVYRAALEGALVDGVVTERERDILERLREKLGIREEDAASMEAELARAA